MTTQNTHSTGSLFGRGPMVPQQRVTGSGGWIKVAEYADYANAEHAVDALSDRRFPVEQLNIVGCDLRMVERVLGRLNWGRAAVSGLATGAWFGLLIGLLFAIFAESASASWALLLGGVLYGALFGALFALIAYGLTRGRRDFVSRSAIVPARYELLADSAVADRAREELSAVR